MPVQVSYPGVYLQEVASGSRTIAGVSTSTALFIGMTDQGPINTPVRVLGYADFERSYGSSNTSGELHDQVKQFFLNGGSTAWIMRIANNAQPAKVELENEGGTDAVLELEAKSAGVLGANIRATINYDTAEPEATFNLLIEQTDTQGGVTTVVASELYKALDMNPSSGKYAVNVLEQHSALVRATDPGVVATAAAYSLWGKWEAGIGTDVLVLQATFTDNKGEFKISVDGSPFRLVTLTNADNSVALVAQRINDALLPVGKSVNVLQVEVGSGNWVWRITSTQSGGLVSFAKSGTANDICEAMQMGTAFGGIDVGGHALRRPVPNGIFGRLGASLIANLGAVMTLQVTPNDITAITVIDTQGSDVSDPANVPSVAPTSFLGARAALDELVLAANTLGRWTAVRHGYRLILRPNYGGASTDGSAYATTTTTGTSLSAGYFWDTGTGNVSSYQLGGYADAQGDFHTGTNAGSDGATPGLEDYDAAYVIAQRDIDLFNMLVLPRSGNQGDGERADLWGPASAFVRSERAVLIVDPPSTWATANDAVDPSTGVSSLRVGVATDHAAVYWPRIKVASDAGTKIIDPAGTMAGIMARIDGTRGVWKAPAGLEANLLGVRGLEHGMSDGENGLINPQALNAVRAFPNGIVSWGARTMVGFDNSGNDDYKYVPVRRLALFIEESLFRGLQWAVFEPNDEPLWRQLRSSAGAFMNGLFRQGAFAGAKASDAFFVKVDRETTTATDINLGIVNVVIGFAPLRPAEFVVITLQQKAGEVQV